MEGILGDLPWTSERSSCQAPSLERLNTTPTFLYSKDHHDFRWTLEGAAVWYSCDGIERFAAFMQSSLFFDLLAAFLDDNINPNDFTTNGLIDLNTAAADGKFRKWRAKISCLSYLAQKRAYDISERLIGFGSDNCDLFEKLTDRFGENRTFDLVALSVRLLLNLLSEVLDDTIHLISAPRGGIWNSFVSGPFLKISPSNKPGPIGMRVKTEIFTDHLPYMDKETLRRHLGRQLNRFSPIPSGVGEGGQAARFLFNTFVSNGWCPYRARELCQSYDYSVLNSLASLKRKVPASENHRMCLQEGRCCSHNIVLTRPDEYPFDHQDHGDHDACDFVHVSIEEVINIIDSGSIPLISLAREGALDLKVVRCTPFIAYTAISHVWSDGRGNPQSNSLPGCILLWLRKLICESYDSNHSPFYDERSPMSVAISQMSAYLHARPYGWKDKKRIYFWMDTLCIPSPSSSRSEERNKDLKFLAMKHITPIFAGATNTLVLEKELQASRFPDPGQLSPDEFAARVLSSKWMQRGWTLEEGSLSMHVVFQMTGKPYPMLAALTHALPILKRHQSPLVRANLNIRRTIPLMLKRSLLEEKQELTNTYPWRASSFMKFYRVHQFAWAWNALLGRSTTKPGDTVLIFANLLDFNVSDMKKTPSDQRLKLLIQSCDELPLSLLYNEPSLPDELGWIPSHIEGSHLTAGAAIRRMSSKGNDQKVTYRIDRSGCDRKSLLILHAPGNHSSFPNRHPCIVRFQSLVDSNLEEEYIVQVHQRTSQERDISHHTSHGSYIVIDLTAGTSSKLGFRGRGVCLKIKSFTKETSHVSYDIPLTAWTSEQTQSVLRPHKVFPIVHTSHVRYSHRILLQTEDASTWCKPLVRRPTLSLSTPISLAIGFIVFFAVLIAVMYAFGRLILVIRHALDTDTSRPSAITLGLLFVYAPLLVIFVMHPVQRYAAIFTYLRWLRSFEDEEDRERRRNAQPSVKRYLRQLWRRLWRGADGTRDVDREIHLV
ncbi:hypothetical protein N7467_000920 [Penicillium canescens]|nr:hypothetical protein N7467_000920 [Penicillium canescens]